VPLQFRYVESMIEKSISGTVEKALMLLTFLSEAGEDGLTLAEIATRAVLAKPTTHRLLTTLVRQAFAERVPKSRSYRIGPAITAIARRAGTADFLTQRWRPCLDQIAESTEAAALLLIRAGDDALCVEASFGRYMVPTLTAGVGGRIPLGLGPGTLIILASLGDDEVRAILARNAPNLSLRSGRTLSDLMARVSRAREDGMAYDGGELLPEVSCVSISVCKHQVAMPMALSLASLSSQMPVTETGRIAEMLRAAIKKMQGRGVAARAVF